MESCICREVDERASQGKFELTDEMLKRYMESKFSRIKRLQEEQRKVEKAVDKVI